MPQYLVEHMRGEEVLAAGVVNAATPLRAAFESTGREIGLLKEKPEFWIRVTTAGKPPFRFIYADRGQVTGA
jgi:hypothetical protein